MNLYAKVAPTASVLIAWLIPLACLSLTWDYLPNRWSQLLFLILATLTGLNSLWRNGNFVVIGTAFFALVLVNFYQLNSAVPAVIAATILFLILLLTGLTTHHDELSVFTEKDWWHWLVIAFLVVQINSLLNFWIIPFFDKAVISFVAFYLFWQYLKIDQTSIRSLRAHFIFVSLTAILILGTIIWINFPHLRIF